MHAAIKDLEEAISLAPESPEAHYNMGCMLMRVQSWALAKQSLNRSLNVFRDHALALLNRGVVNFHLGRSVDQQRLSALPQYPGRALMQASTALACRLTRMDLTTGTRNRCSILTLR